MNWIECHNQVELDRLIAEHGEKLNVRIVGEWDSVVIPAGATVGDIYVYGTVGGGIYVCGTATVGSIDVCGTVKGCIDVCGTAKGGIGVHGTVMCGSHLAEDFAAGPMLELFAACPGGLEAGTKGWGNREWSNCPLHEALASVADVGGFGDVDKIITDPRLRIFARLFVSLHDQGQLAMPSVEDVER